MFESFAHLNFSRYSLGTLLACSWLSDSGEGVKEWGRCERERREKEGEAFSFSCLYFNSAEPTILEPGAG